MDKTTWWRCDTCGDLIDSPEDGWIEWLVDDDLKIDGLRLVHHMPASPRKQSGCQYNEQRELKSRRVIVADASLENFLGPDGLVDLLTMLDRAKERAQVVDMIQRLHVPGYEEARPYFKRALAEGEIETNLPPGFFSQSMIRGVIAAYGEPDEDDEPGS